MVQYCCAYNCNNHSDFNKTLPEAEKIKFHLFPLSDPERLQKWINAVKRKKFKPTKSTVLCHHHFVDTDYRCALVSNKLMLKKDAVPSVFNHPEYLLLKNQSTRRVLPPRDLIPQSEVDDLNAEDEGTRKRGVVQPVVSISQAQETFVDANKSSKLCIGKPKIENTPNSEGVEEQNEIKPTGIQLSEVAFIKQEEDPVELQEIKIIKDEAISENEHKEDLDVALERPLGDGILRVCRSCLKVLKVEDTIPMVAYGPSSKIELYKKLTGIMGLDLLPVKNPCVCKNCENFINAVHQFKETFNSNEVVLMDFDWSNKTKDLLHIVDQDVLKAVYSECCKEKTGIVSHSTWEDVGSSPTDDLSRIERDKYNCKKLDGKGNVLMNMDCN